MSKKEKKVKDAKSIFHEEMVQSPWRTALKNFVSRRLSILGMCIFLFIFLSCFILSLAFPIDLYYTDSTRQNLPPALNYLSIPGELAGNAKIIDLGSTYGVGVDKQNRLYMWGTMNDKLKNNVPSNMGVLKMISCGFDHIVAVNEQNQVFAWGNDRLNITKIPDEVQGKDLVDIQAGYQVSFALDADGTMYTWGNFSNFAADIRAENGNYKEFAINISTVLALTKDGRIISMAGRDSQFNNIPDIAQGNSKAVASADYVGAALLNDGTVVTWGLKTKKSYTVPDEIQGRVIDLAGGREHFTALLDDGSVYSWGDNNLSQINFPASVNVEKINVDYYQNLGIDRNGKVVTWGQKGYLMGTDHMGRDVFVRLIHGGKITLTVGFIAVAISGILGILIGGISGYYGGKLDMFLMRLGEVISAIPFLPLAIILAAVVAHRISETQRVMMIMVILGVLGYPGMARLTRAQILAEKENEFVTAARAMGIKQGVIIFRHILPNVLAIVLVSLTLSMASCLLWEASLSFLGFGIIEPTPTWGNMLNGCVNSIVIRNQWWRWAFPSIALGLCTVSINIMGDGFRDAIDPKSGER